MYSDEGEFIGMNNTLASSILIKFNENEISEVSFYRNPDGNVISENKIIVNEMKLPGFIWRENEKPESINDLFSEADKKINIVAFTFTYISIKIRPIKIIISVNKYHCFKNSKFFFRQSFSNIHPLSSPNL